MICTAVPVRKILLPHGRTALIDADDWDRELSVGFRDGEVWHGRICDASWYTNVKSHTSYAVSKWYPSGKKGKPYEVRLHRVILCAKAGVMVDHINHDGLDNRRLNLRVTSFLGNSANRRVSPGKRFKGVFFHKQTGKYEAAVRCHGVKHHPGLFAVEEDAALAYNVKAAELFGEFAHLNPC